MPNVNLHRAKIVTNLKKSTKPTRMNATLQVETIQFLLHELSVPRSTLEPQRPTSMVWGSGDCGPGEFPEMQYRYTGRSHFPRPSGCKLNDACLSAESEARSGCVRPVVKTKAKGGLTSQ